MAEKNENGTMHPMWNPHRFILLRIILGLIILGIVFGVGMQIGELKGIVESGGYGGGMMRHYNPYGDNMYYRMPAPMQAPATSTAPAPGKASNSNTTTTNTNK